jgi:hypothetical protein
MKTQNKLQVVAKLALLLSVMFAAVGETDAKNYVEEGWTLPTNYKPIESVRVKSLTQDTKALTLNLVYKDDVADFESCTEQIRTQYTFPTEDDARIMQKAYDAGLHFKVVTYSKDMKQKLVVLFHKEDVGEILQQHEDSRKIVESFVNHCQNYLPIKLEDGRVLRSIVSYTYEGSDIICYNFSIAHEDFARLTKEDIGQCMAEDLESHKRAEIFGMMDRMTAVAGLSIGYFFYDGDATDAEASKGAFMGKNALPVGVGIKELEGMSVGTLLEHERSLVQSEGEKDYYAFKGADISGKELVCNIEINENILREGVDSEKAVEFFNEAYIGFNKARYAILADLGMGVRFNLKGSLSGKEKTIEVGPERIGRIVGY